MTFWDLNNTNQKKVQQVRGNANVSEHLQNSPEYLPQISIILERTHISVKSCSVSLMSGLNNT